MPPIHSILLDRREMIVEIPDQDLGSISLSPSDGRLELAIGVYTGRQLTLGQAAQLAEIPYVFFMRELGRRGIALNYSMEDALHDMTLADDLSASKQELLGSLQRNINVAG